MASLAPVIPFPGHAATEIPPQAYVIAAAYREAGKGRRSVRRLTRLFAAVPHMETSILAAWDELETAAPCLT